MMANIDELNKSIGSYSKYVGEKQRHDNNIFNMNQKRVRIFTFMTVVVLDVVYIDLTFFVIVLATGK